MHTACPKCSKPLPASLGALEPTARAACGSCKAQFTVGQAADHARREGLRSEEPPEANFEYETNTPSRIVSTEPRQHKSNFLNYGFFATLTAIALLILFSICSGVLFVGNSNNRNDVDPQMVLQSLVDSIESKLGTNALGEVKVREGHATITVESDFFSRMGPDIQRALCEKLHAEWVDSMYGKKTTFKTWNGEIIAELD